MQFICYHFHFKISRLFSTMSDDESIVMSGQAGIWDIILEDTIEINRDLLDVSSNMFKDKFQQMFLSNAQSWILKIFNFMENDEVKASIWETKEKLDFDDDTEGIMAAIDQRKYKIFKDVINWNEVKSLIDENSEENGDNEGTESDEVEA